MYYILQLHLNLSCYISNSLHSLHSFAMFMIQHKINSVKLAMCPAPRPSPVRWWQRKVQVSKWHHFTAQSGSRWGEDWDGDKYFLTMPQPRYFIGTVRVEWWRWRWMRPLRLINAVISDHRRGAPSKFVKICCRNIPTEGCCYVLFLHGAIGHTGLIGSPHTSDYRACRNCKLFKIFWR